MPSKTGALARALGTIATVASIVPGEEAPSRFTVAEIVNSRDSESGSDFRSGMVNVRTPVSPRAHESDTAPGRGIVAACLGGEIGRNRMVHCHRTVRAPHTHELDGDLGGALQHLHRPQAKQVEHLVSDGDPLVPVGNAADRLGRSGKDSSRDSPHSKFEGLRFVVGEVVVQGDNDGLLPRLARPKVIVEASAE